jgi:hypothetical protein
VHYFLDAFFDLEDGVAGLDFNFDLVSSDDANPVRNPTLVQTWERC